MDKKQIEAYSYYKKLYPGTIVLYHIESYYVALGDDAAAVVKSLVETADGTLDIYKFSCDDLNVIARLEDVFQLKMVDYRNDDGKLDFPDIQRLKQEKYEDY